MRDFKDEYRIQADKHEISKKILIQTKDKIMVFQKPRKHFAIKTIIIAAALIVCMSISVFAYEYHQYKLTNNNAGRNHEYLDSENESAQVINKTAEGKNISITLKDVKPDEKGIYFTVVLKTTDGSDLNINTEECVPVLERQGFETAYFIVDNKNIDFTAIFRTDDGSDSTEAVLELVYYDSSDLISSLQGKDIKIVLENYKYEVTINESIDFTYSDIGTMLDQAGLAMDSDFSEVGINTTFANGVEVPAYTLNAGEKKVYFSNKYPKTYIDNIGIYESGDTYFKQLYVSIVPESDKVREELLSNLALFNMETGHFVYAQQPYINDGNGRYVQPDDGRIVLIFNAGMGIYDEINECYCVDTTIEILKNFEFRLYTSSETKTVKNTWDMNFNLENVNTALSYELNIDIQKGDSNGKVDKVQVSDSNLTIEGSADAGFEFKPMGKIYLILADGTKIDAGPKLSGGYDEFDRKFSISIYLETLVNADDVTAIELWNNTIELK